MTHHQMQCFDFDDHLVRVVMRGDAPWFVAMDVCRVLGINNNRKAVEKLDEDEKGVTSSYTLGGNQEVLTVSESGLYTIILRSRAATTPGSPAHRFRKWVTAEVLPQIRRTGSYNAPGSAAPDVAMGEDGEEPLQLGTHRWLSEIAMVREARRVHGVASARALWRKLGLPEVDEMTPVARQAYNVTACGEAVEEFIADCCVEAPGHRTRLLDLWQAYTAWCEVKGRVPLKLQTVGRHFKERGYPRVKASITHYVGVALKQPEAPQPPDVAQS